jgi:hypothetical protein
LDLISIPLFLPSAAEQHIQQSKKKIKVMMDRDLETATTTKIT